MAHLGFGMAQQVCHNVTLQFPPYPNLLLKNAVKGHHPRRSEVLRGYQGVRLVAGRRILVEPGAAIEFPAQESLEDPFPALRAPSTYSIESGEGTE